MTVEVYGLLQERVVGFMMTRPALQSLLKHNAALHLEKNVQRQCMLG